MDTVKTKSMHWLTKLAIAGFVIFLLYILFVVGMVFSPDIDQFVSRRDFDSVKWKEWKETESTMFMRRNMVHDLTKQHDLVGMNRTEIIELLGKPNSENKKTIGYDLGPTGSWIDYGWLSLSLNENSDVEEYDLHEH